jgi:imidazoleglycerol-phosphate dehydratase
MLGWMTARVASLKRETNETAIDVELEVDGTGRSEIDTGIPFFDHMLTSLSRHSLFNLRIKAKGDLQVDLHHTVEDTGIVLGKCLSQALGAKTGIVRYGWSLLAMDEALAQVAIDLGGRAFLEFRAPRGVPPIGQFEFGLVEEFLRAFSSNAAMNLHVEIRYGHNNHHLAEAIFKGLAKSLDQACRIDPRISGIPSSKGTLDG